MMQRSYLGMGREGSQSGHARLLIVGLQQVRSLSASDFEARRGKACRAVRSWRNCLGPLHFCVLTSAMRSAVTRHGPSAALGHEEEWFSLADVC